MKFQTPKGTSDFLPEETIVRDYVIQIIKKIFESYGFDSIETPAFEELELLTAKSGEEVAKQIFRIESEKESKFGLRFDQTVPLARVIVNNPQIPKPFKRYIIAPAWRYEEPQAGRMRQFYQADVDVIGSTSMEADVECIACAVDCLKELGFRNIKVRVNDRKILEGFVDLMKSRVPEEMKVEFGSTEVFRAIDKIGKIGVDGVKEELEKIGLLGKQIEDLLGIITITGDFEEILRKGEKLLEKTAEGKRGIEEIKELYNFSKSYGISDLLYLDFSLARGLDYYTGPIFEIEAETKKRVGSIAGGGRYDNLIGLLGGSSTPATGISLGIERIVETIKEEGMTALPKTRVMVFVANVDDKLKKEVIKIAQKLRKKGISCQTDLMRRNLTKQLEFANRMEIPFVLIVGERELKKKKFKIKNMRRKFEKELSLEQVIKMLKNNKD